MTGDWAASSPALPSRCQITVLKVLPPSAGTGMYKLEGSFFSDTRDKLEEWEGDWVGGDGTRLSSLQASALMEWYAEQRWGPRHLSGLH